METFALEAIGTQWKIDIHEELPSDKRAVLLGCVRDRIESYDRTYSRFRPDSLVTAMSKEAGDYRLPDDFGPMIELYERLYRLTGGAFTPLIGQTLVEAGYDSEYSLVPKKLHPLPTWEETMSYVYPVLTLKRPWTLDFGAGGKGYLADLVSRVILSHGIESFCVDAGGDIVYHGRETVRIGLEDPHDPTNAVGVATILNGSICGSAGTHRAWGDFQHTIDPRMLASPKDILAVWTMAATGLLADALATALSFVPAETLAKEYDFDYVILRPDASVECSPHAPVELFIE